VCSSDLECHKQNRFRVRAATGRTRDIRFKTNWEVVE
jgi:hypothetical protein